VLIFKSLFDNGCGMHVDSDFVANLDVFTQSFFFCRLISPIAMLSVSTLNGLGPSKAKPNVLGRDRELGEPRKT